ncbi:hypothetical protein L798_13018, partial [Zootermopsis nevadensis]
MLRMRGAVAVSFLFLGCYFVVCAEFPVAVTASLIADVRAHLYSGCVYILHSYFGYDKELAAVWSAAAGLLNIGVLHVQHLIYEGYDSCPSPLYVVLNRDLLILSEVSAAGKFSGARWLVFLHSVSELSLLDVPFDCEFLAAQWDGEVARLNDVYRISPRVSLQVRYFGDWSLSSRRNWPSVGLYRRRTSLDGHVIRTVILEDETYVSLDRMDNEVVLGGYIGHIWSELETEMNFKSNFCKSIDGGTGSEKNGTWDGMVGMLVRDEAEVGASSFLMTVKRMEVVDYTYSIDEAGTNVYIKRPKEYSLSWNVPMAPFSFWLWFCVMVAMGLLSLILPLACNIQRHHGNRNERAFGFRDSWLCTLGIFCQQGHNETPRSCAGRVVYLTSHMCAIVLLAGYAGNYISYLSAGRPLVMPFTSLSEMLDDGSYRLGVIAKSAQLNFFDKATDSLFKEVYEKLILPDIHNLPSDYVDAFKRVCESKYAFMSSANVMRRFTANLSCSVIALPRATIPGVIAMTTAKKFPYLGLINH